MRDHSSLPGTIAIVRLSHPAPIELLHALRDGGITQAEVTLTTPRCVETVAAWRAAVDDVTIGVGSVRTRADVTAAASAGAQFLVTPGTSAELLTAASEIQLPVVCGAATPTEIANAMTWGATSVKVFPVDQLGGTQYIRAIRAPLPDIPLVPTGGVDAANTREYAALGCVGVGVGSSLIDPDLVVRRDWDALTRRASAFVSAWGEGLR